MKLGETLGPYRVLAKRGEGGMGEVYRARDTMRDRNVAITILPELFACTSGTDSDRVVKLIDVYPDDVAGQPATAGTN